MVNKKAIKRFISDIKTQAQRDLDSAQVLLELKNPHLENVAFLLEQSFEKITKASYTRYKFETGVTVWEEIYENISEHDAGFIIEMFDEIRTTYTKTIPYILKACRDITDVPPKEIEEMLRLLEKTINLPPQIPNLKEEIRLAKKNFFENMSTFNSKSIPDHNIKPSEILQSFNITENTTHSESSVNDINLKTFRESIAFVLYLNMARYSIIHATSSRYPLKRYNMRNLEAYRNNPKLKGFFNSLANSIQKMLYTESSFTTILVKIHAMNSDILRHASKT